MKLQTNPFKVFGKHVRGTVLIVTIWIITMLASLVIVFAYFIRVESLATANSIASVQAETVANGAISYIFSMLSADRDLSVSYASKPYEAVQVGQGYFWVLRPNLADDRNYDFGLSDESGKINLNSVSLETLLKLPSMTAELANSIIDWRDGNEEVTPGGAESEYYLLQSEPYQCKNAPLETVEEVLLIKGGDMQLLYGEDRNRNGILDANENDAEQSPPSDNSNGRLDPGFFNYVTVNSYEPDTNQNDNLINVNDARSQGQLAELIGQVVSQDDMYRIMNNIRQRRNYSNLIEFYRVSEMKYDDFNKIINRLTIGSRGPRSGLINMNTAPEAVLLCLPGLEQSDVDALIKKRSSQSESENSILWVTEVLSQEKAEAIGSYITSQSYQYSADIVAVSSDGRAFRRYYVIVDTASGQPLLVYKQPLHSLGWPLEPTILEHLRAGQKI